MIDRFAKIIVELKKILRVAAGTRVDAPRRRVRSTLCLSRARSPSLALTYSHCVNFQIAFSQELFHLDKNFF